MNQHELNPLYGLQNAPSVGSPTRNHKVERDEFEVTRNASMCMLILLGLLNSQQEVVASLQPLKTKAKPTKSTRHWQSLCKAYGRMSVWAWSSLINGQDCGAS